MKHEVTALNSLSLSFGNKMMLIKFHVPLQYAITTGAAITDENITSRNTRNAACTVSGVTIIPSANPAVLPRIFPSVSFIYAFVRVNWIFFCVRFYVRIL